MSALEGNSAIVALADRLRSGTACPELAEPPLERLRLALDDPYTTSTDRAVLLRHALRCASLKRGTEVEFADSDLPRAVAKAAGLESRPSARGRSFAAAPWRPAWLPGTDLRAADETAMRAERRRFFPGDGVPGDPFLRALRRTTYRSIGQRAAVRAALAMPPGAILAIDLPTGEGKSTVFAAIDQVGFAADPPGRPRGVTLVVVPTVTLALDHERNCGGSDTRPLAYVGGSMARNEAIRAAIDGDNQGLCFAAPEAATGPLRRSLGRAAARGTLRAVVVDEAHLVEGWGTGFRTDFQTFAGVCRSWSEACASETRFRIVMLSATLTEAGERVLAELFSPETRIEVVSAARARPEIEYWTARPCARDVRDARVREAILHLPRPAILYVTEVKAAEEWFACLRSEGFGRLRLVHGRTPAEERERVLRLWSEGSLDLVVATSAFGLGVDYAHVRAVIHACVPESFDRFYQEAGRAGRDGCAAISLVLPADSDFKVAESLAQRSVISVERGLERWGAMFSHHSVIRHGHPRYGVRLDVAPGYSPEDIDLVGQRSIDWNARTLALMARAGLLRLAGVPDAPPDESIIAGNAPRIDVEIADEGHLQRLVWDAKVEPKRTETAMASESSLRLMREFLREGQCPGRLVSSLYATETRRAAVACGGCAVCRADPSARTAEGLVGERLPPWPAQGMTAAGLTGLLGAQRRLLVVYPGQEPSKRDLRDLRDTVRRLDTWGVRIFARVGATPSWLSDTVTEAVWERPWFAIEDTGFFPVRWPRGTRLVASGVGLPVNPATLRAEASDPGMILMIPDGTADATRLDRAVIDIAPCPVLALEEFMTRVLR